MTTTPDTHRTHTPDRVNDDGSTTITMKRACNGCGQLLGDITDHEMTAAVYGEPLPDVRSECPACAPTAPPPACLPMRIVSGDALCVEAECDHEPVDGDYCDEVTEQVICGTHSEINNDGAVTRAVPWPCQHVAPAAAPV